MHILTQLIVWLNVAVNRLSSLLLGPIAALPGWLSNTITSAATGLLLIIVFKYTSNQHAIERIRNDIKANLLAIKLFKDSITVTLQSQGRILRGAFLLLLHAIPPMLAMIVPISLLLGQLSLWYQHRPLLTEEETLVYVRLKDTDAFVWPEVRIDPAPAAEVTTGQVRVLSKREIYWKIKALKCGYHRIFFKINGEELEKELAIGDGFMRVSARRPAWRLVDVLRHPAERPFRPNSLVQSITVDYPDRLSRTSGTGSWLVYFFIASLVFALIFKQLLKVRI